jgi:hypothetical protein
MSSIVAQPGRCLPLVLGGGGVEGSIAVPRRLPVEVGAPGEQVAGDGELTGSARVPERDGDVIAIRRRLARLNQRSHRLRQAQGGRVRKPGLGAALPEPPHGRPLRVAERGLDRRAAVDRRSGMLDVGAGVEERVDQHDVIVAGRPVQRRLVVPGVAGMSVQIGPGRHEFGHDRGGIRAVTGRVGEMMQRCAPAGPAGSKAGIHAEYAVELLGISALDRAQQLEGGPVAVGECARDPRLGRLLGRLPRSGIL